MTSQHAHIQINTTYWCFQHIFIFLLASAQLRDMGSTDWKSSDIRFLTTQFYLWLYNIVPGLLKHSRNCLYGVSMYPSNGATFGSPTELLKLPERVFHERWVSAWFISLHCYYPDDRLSMIDGTYFVKTFQLKVPIKIITVHGKLDKHNNIFYRKIQWFLML